MPHLVLIHQIYTCFLQYLFSKLFFDPQKFKKVQKIANFSCFWTFLGTSKTKIAWNAKILLSKMNLNYCFPLFHHWTPKILARAICQKILRLKMLFFTVFLAQDPPFPKMSKFWYHFFVSLWKSTSIERMRKMGIDHQKPYLDFQKWIF